MPTGSIYRSELDDMAQPYLTSPSSLTGDGAANFCAEAVFSPDLGPAPVIHP